MVEELVLITGVSGFIGHAVLRKTLESGYRVRAIVRKELNIEQTQKALANPELISKVEFSVVADLAAPNAFANSMLGVSHIIHVASPLPSPSDDYERDYFRPAIDMTVNILKAAHETATVRRVVITSSMAAYIPAMDFVAGELQKKVYRADDKICHYDIKTPFNHPLFAYAASKSMALDAAEEFLAKEKPNFDIIFLVPSMVLGEDPLAITAKDVTTSSNGALMRLLLGEPGRPTLGSAVSLQDVAALHVLALDSKVPAGRYMVASGRAEGTNFLDAFNIVRKHFPAASEKVFAKQGEMPIVKINVDTSKTEKAFGFTFQSYEEQVKSVVSSYLSLLKKEGKY
ncbi:hypothetical protein EG329_007698 [Mollisiaceae sp. DMI_Dod_QoI]|nr:hypothetical protein EG329_007698 [Helotiales sp. DMI_Dod_QoI]